MHCGLGWPKEPCITSWLRSPQQKGQFAGFSGPLKCISLFKQRVLLQHRAADLFAGDTHHGKNVA